LPQHAFILERWTEAEADARPFVELHADLDALAGSPEGITLEDVSAGLRVRRTAEITIVLMAEHDLDVALLKASASEVAAMVEGAVRHGSTMKLKGNYTDTHGQSLIGLGVTRLGHRPAAAHQADQRRAPVPPRVHRQRRSVPSLAPALHGPVNWRVIAENYDTVVKYATAIHERTASTEAVLSRFPNAVSHPAYQAMLEIGKAQRTIFVARYLYDRDLQRQIESGLNVVEAWNRANAVICYGKSGEISTNRREEVEMTALCLRILQASLVYVNTVMLQDVLAEPAWSVMLTPSTGAP
jgi:TnpA family transposase